MRLRLAALALALAAGSALAAPAGAPAPGEALVDAGVALYEDGAFGKAAGKLEAALKADPRNARGLYYLGNSYWRMDNFDRAAAAFSRLLEVDPGGPFAADARDWLDAQGSFDVLAARIQVHSRAEVPTRLAAVSPTMTMQDGCTRLKPPPGWTKAVDDIVRQADREVFYRLVFKKDLGGGQSASLLVEAHHRGATPDPAAGRKTAPEVVSVLDRALAEQGITDYHVTRSRTISGGQELEFTTDLDQGAQGSARGAWDGTSLLITVAIAPKAAWRTVGRQIAEAVGSVRVSGAPVARAGAVVRAASASASPGMMPTATPMPDVPMFRNPMAGGPTLPPGLYLPPWATPTPK